MIDVSHLTKFYGPTRSIEDISFSVAEGEVVGFLGPNGAGKSTTMRMLVGLSRPTRGTARIGGFDIQKDYRKIHRMLGYVPEGAPLYGDMTLEGYLLYMGGLKGLGAREAKLEMERATSEVNLVRERRRLLRNLSKGTRQRAVIAQALLGDPKVLIFDEPTVGLDPTQINDVRRLVKSMVGRRTMILSTHILPEVELTCSRILIIADGTLVAQGTPESLVAELPRPFRIVVRGRQDALRAKLPAVYTRARSVTEDGDNAELLFAEAPSEAERARVSRELVEAGFDIIEFAATRPRLEDAFMSAIGGGKP